MRALDEQLSLIPSCRIWKYPRAHKHNTATHPGSTSAPPPSFSPKTAYKSHTLLRNRLLWTDQRSIVTGTPAAHLQAVHLINDIRHCSKNPEKAQVREDIEPAGTRLQTPGVLRKGCCVRAQRTCECHPFGAVFPNRPRTICLTVLTTVPEQQLKALDQKLKSDNKEWAERVKTNPTAKRDLDNTQPPYVVNKLSVLILSTSFLFNGRPISVLPNHHRHLAPGGGVDNQSTNYRQWKNYHRSQRLEFADDQDNALEVVIQDNRDPGEKLSIFALLVNSYNKLHDFANRWQANAAADFEDPEGSVQFIASAGPSSVHQRNDYGGEDHESDESSSENDDGLINGLTHAEMRTVIQRTGDGSLSGAERVNAAMLIFSFDVVLTLALFLQDTKTPLMS
ncbi:unnamed protein product [Cyclocybe aegerita]|uniref:Uncharacterized protein n=1 Tax=Cyclocybe aegerita TaxID=1973307 RepID=A0A8S0X9Q7_CYCAE|nr:unnamed protein product [Cyclocybe aegerita]